MAIGMHQMPELLGGCAPCGPAGMLVGMNGTGGGFKTSVMDQVAAAAVSALVVPPLAARTSRPYEWKWDFATRDRVMGAVTGLVLYNAWKYAQREPSVVVDPTVSGLGISVSELADRALPPAQPTPPGHTSLERTGSQVGSVLDRIIPVEYRPLFIAFAVGYWLGLRRR